MDYRQGQVCAALIHPERGEPKRRPVVIITRTEEIRADQPVVVVAVSTTFTEPLSADQIELPFETRGRCSTGLARRSVAVCSWLTKLATSDLGEVRGHVPPPILLKILERVRTHLDRTAGEQ